MQAGDHLSRTNRHINQTFRILTDFHCASIPMHFVLLLAYFKVWVEARRK